MIEEAGRGDKSAASRRLSALENIEILQLDARSIELSKALISQGGMPKKALDDALHVAVSAVNHIDFLLTWNFRHIDNAEIKPK